MLGGKLKKGNVEIEFPAAGSKMAEEAAVWLEESRSKVMSFIDKSVDLESQTKQAVDLLNDLIVAARASLKDEALQAYIDMTIRPQTFAELKAIYGKGGKGLAVEPLYQNILDKAFKQTQKIMDDIVAQAKVMEACFVAGTLVHTREGLKPIEEIKVGDYVLSKPESGEGELCYQPVTQTFEHDDKEVFYLALSALRELQ
jgi:hypothetical protein